MAEELNVAWDDNPVDVSKETDMIWSIANKLRGVYQSDKYKEVIIPMTIIRRFECALAKTKKAVVEKYAANPKTPEKILSKVAGFQFYNTSEYTLKELTNDPDHLAENFTSYLKGFSSNAQQIIWNLDFDKQITKMDTNNRLLSVVTAFSELDLDPETVDSIKMGYIFEDLIRRFSENAEAGDHYTGRDIIRCMVAIALAEGADDIFDDKKNITICDQAAGTGGMLTTAYNYIKKQNETADIRLFAQEVNPESYAECLAEMLIKGQDETFIKRVDTFKEDCFPDIKMRFVLENPPFGTAWGGKDAAEGDEEAVIEEHKKGFAGRWGAGLPGTGDAQLIFMQSAIDKMNEKNGRAVIVENGSPLFSGGTASGESQIRRWMLEQDLIEAIIALPTDLFYNTGIQTYLWVLSKNKREERKGKVQLIDASAIYHPLRRALGKKRNEISTEDREEITQLYANFEENERCKIFDNEDFMYREYVVMQPLQRSYSITEESIERLRRSNKLQSFYDGWAVEKLKNSEDALKASEQKKLDKYMANESMYQSIFTALRQNMSDKKYMSPEEFKPVLEAIMPQLIKQESALMGKIADGLSVMDKEAVIQRDRKGNIIYDTETKDVEIVPYKENINDYMKREVLPYVPDAKAFFEENLKKKTPVIKTGAEIPFTRYFYQYEAPQEPEVLEERFLALEKDITTRVAELFQ